MHRATDKVFVEAQQSESLRRLLLSVQPLLDEPEAAAFHHLCHGDRCSVAVDLLLTGLVVDPGKSESVAAASAVVDAAERLTVPESSVERIRTLLKLATAAPVVAANPDVGIVATKLKNLADAIEPWDSQTALSVRSLVSSGETRGAVEWLADQLEAGTTEELARQEFRGRIGRDVAAALSDRLTADVLEAAALLGVSGKSVRLLKGLTMSEREREATRLLLDSAVPLLATFDEDRDLFESYVAEGELDVALNMAAFAALEAGARPVLPELARTLFEASRRLGLEELGIQSLKRHLANSD